MFFRCNIKKNKLFKKINSLTFTAFLKQLDIMPHVQNCNTLTTALNRLII